MPIDIEPSCKRVRCGTVEAPLVMVNADTVSQNTGEDLAKIVAEKLALAKLSTAEERCGALEGFEITLAANASEEGKLYGSIGPREIADAVAAQGPKLEKAEVIMGEGPIRYTGEHDVLIHVCDNGPGVAPEDRPRMFEAFFTTKPKGVGLGLSICKSIAAAHGGSLHYAAMPGDGSRFTLSLPRKSIG